VGAPGFIRWSNEEKIAVATEAFRLVSADPKLHPADAVARGQIRALKDKARHRKFDGGENRRRVNEWIKPIWDSIAATAPGESEPTAPVVAAPVAAIVGNSLHLAAVQAVETGQIAMPGIPAEAPQKVRVFWKPDEIEAVALAAAKLFVRGEEKSDLSIMREAMEATLPPSRWKVTKTIANVGDAYDRAMQLMPVVRRNIERKAEEEREDREAQARLEAAERERAEREARDAELRDAAETETQRAQLIAEEQERAERIRAEALRQAVAIEVQKRLDAAGYTDLIGAIAKKVMGDFFGGLAEQIKADAIKAAQDGFKAVADELKAAPHVAAGAVIPSGVQEIQKAPHLPKVVVVGLGTQEYDDLRRTYFGQAEFKLVKVLSGTQNSHAAEAMLNAAEGQDVVLAMVPQCGASVQVAGESKLKIPFIKITGGHVRAMKNWLRSWINGEIALAKAA
jgi:hypothetical protein